MQTLDHTAVALYERLTSDQLRDLLAAYVGVGKAASLSQRSREEIIKHLDGGSDPLRLALLAHRVETVSPFKHCFLYGFDGANPPSFKNLVEGFQASFPGLDKRFVPLQSGNHSMEPQLSVIDTENE